MAAAAFTNVDMLAWFADDERAVCSYCGIGACVSYAEAQAAFCLSCGAVSINGVRIDVDGRVDLDSSE